MNMVKTDLIKTEPGQRREIRVPSKTIEIEFRCQHDESSDSEYCWLNGLTGRFNSAAFIYYYDKVSGKIFLKSRRGDFWARGGEGCFEQVKCPDLSDCSPISYLLACEFESADKRRHSVFNAFDRIDYEEVSFFYTYDDGGGRVLACETWRNEHFVYMVTTSSFEKIHNAKMAFQIKRQTVLDYFGANELPEEDSGTCYFRIGHNRETQIFKISPTKKVTYLARSTSTIGAGSAVGEYSSAFPYDSVWEFSDNLPQFGMRRLSRAEALKIAFAMSMWGRSVKTNNGYGLICDVMYDIKYCSYLRFFQTPRIPGRPLLADPIPSKIYAVDCIGISYVLHERPEGLNVEHNGDARLEYAGIDVDCRGARKMTLDQVLQHILDVGGHYCEDEPDEGEE